MTDVANTLRALTARLAAAGIGTAALDASLLLAEVLGVGKVELRLAPEREVPDASRVHLEQLAAQREARVPLAQVLGRAEFWSLSFEVTPETLTPRPETEGVVEAAVDWMRRLGETEPVIAEVGTGTGCIAVAVAREIPGAEIHSVDVSAGALAVAGRNVTRHGVADRVHLHHGSYLEPLAGLPEGSFSAVVSNPPYVRTSEGGEVDPEVRHEPRSAVFCAGEPAEVYRAIAVQAAPLVRPGGALIVELPEDPAGACARGIDGVPGWVVIRADPDLAGIPRVLVAERRSSIRESTQIEKPQRSH